MNASRLGLLACLIGICVASVAAADVHAHADSVFAQANQEFAAGHFREAIAGYESLVREKQWSANLFYDLGNAQFRAGDLGQAILNYERALALEPNYPEALANLRLGRDEARALELQRNGPERYLAAVSVSQCTWAAAVGMWAVLFAICGLRFRRNRGGAWPAILVFGLVLTAACVSAIWWLETFGKNAGLAIVTAKDVQARLATADRTDTVLVLPAGSEIRILNTRGDWIYAALPNDLRGWLPAKTAESVRL